ncbi:hypothetical protein CkaCkLH20_10238 [Colletotrichum karsti]|uniref:Uncharacterized protein n=1 Tax=Colletotrichum karsti TaxID=1095194 RepID=A0A9P6I044_9PEZI|nr:uncharacterized protein CkaCkLH20_10238 [Colletotrichum karsti]KAF9872411.1 hypothetical protein CkaCkLH20_10238 [Colletotrichum karsti]
MVTARFYKNISRWRLERPRGIKLSVLEQISGSQSFASAVERFYTIRTQMLIGSLILFIWSLSPIGGQSSSRLLTIAKKADNTTGIVYYGYADLKYSAFIGASSWSNERSIVTSIYTTVLLSDPKSKRSWSDPWQSPRIPMLPRARRHDTDGSWRQVDSTALALGHDTYASLVGLKLQGLRFEDRTTQYDFNVSYSYIELTCSQARIFSSVEEADSFLSDKNFNLTARLLDDGWDVNFAIKVSWNNGTTDQGMATNALNHVPPLHLSYLSMSGVSEDFRFYLFECAPMTIDVETSMICTEERCTPIQQRQVPNPRPSVRSFPASINYSELMSIARILPTLAGKTRTDMASPTENYIADDEPVYGQQPRRMWNDTDMEVFSDRFTTIFNTVWQASLDPRTVINASLTDLPIFEDGVLPRGTNQTSARITSTRNVYSADVIWATVLITITIILQGLAIAGFTLQFLIRGPDILGFASTLTRDNSFVPVAGGSTLGGAERARALGDLRLRLSDIRSGEDGYIAVNSILAEHEGEKIGSAEGGGNNWRVLDKHRVYI